MDAAALAKDQINSETSAKGAKVIVANAPSSIIGLFTYSSTTICLGDDLTISFDNLWGELSDCGETQIQYSLDGGATWEQLGKGTVTNGEFSVTFTPEEGTYSFRASFVGNADGCKDGFDNLKFQDNTSLAAVVVAPCVEDICNYSQGYFKNHSEVWAGTSLMLGSVTYSDSDLLFILNRTSSGGNSYVILAHQLITIKLNALRGVDVSSIQSDINNADLLIDDANLKTDSIKDEAMNDLGNLFDTFIKANHCDDEE